VDADDGDVLLPDLSRLSCHSVQQMFLKVNTRHQAHKPVNNCNYWGAIFETEWSRGSNCVSVQNFAVIVGDRFKRRRDMAIFSTFEVGGRRYNGFLKF